MCLRKARDGDEDDDDATQRSVWHLWANIFMIFTNTATTTATKRQKEATETAKTKHVKTLSRSASVSATTSVRRQKVLFLLFAYTANRVYRLSNIYEKLCIIYLLHFILYLAVSEGM